MPGDRARLGLCLKKKKKKEKELRHDWWEWGRGDRSEKPFGDKVVLV